MCPLGRFLSFCAFSSQSATIIPVMISSSLGDHGGIAPTAHSYVYDFQVVRAVLEPHDRGETITDAEGLAHIQRGQLGVFSRQSRGCICPKRILKESHLKGYCLSL